LEAEENMKQREKEDKKPKKARQPKSRKPE
jgi:hypothetical protein